MSGNSITSVTRGYVQCSSPGSSTQLAAVRVRGCGLGGAAGRGASCWVPGDVVRAVISSTAASRHRVVSSQHSQQRHQTPASPMLLLRCYQHLLHLGCLSVYSCSLKVEQSTAPANTCCTLLSSPCLLSFSLLFDPIHFDTGTRKSVHVRQAGETAGDRRACRRS